MILNVTQCVGGRVEQGRYATSAAFNELNIVPGADLTVEAAITKLMFLLGQGISTALLPERMVVPLAGELTLR